MKSAIAVTAALSASAVSASQCSVSNKIDCGYSGITQSGCESKGCCWSPAYGTDGAQLTDTPWCFYAEGDGPKSCFALNTELSEPFSASEVSTMRSYFLKNINIDGKGGVVAAPDTETPGGSYYYHWMRDGALTMRALQETSSNSTEYDTQMQAYVGWVLHVQSESSPNGIDVRTEPKFFLPDGGVFNSGWCRPQNDGPGLRATTLMMYANTLIAQGKIDYVKKYLWTGSSQYNGGAIKYDLDYIINGYSTASCDLWEEYTNADLFWNRFTMKKAMLSGSAFATTMGDSATASTYSSTSSKINSDLYKNHWTGTYVQEATGRTMDGAVIVGFNDGFDSTDSLFFPTSFEVASTVNQYNIMFCSEYSINTQDTAAGVPGVLYGRYKGDSYAGGNPWQLLTAALGQLFYRGASYLLDHGLPNTDAVEMWALAFNKDKTAFNGYTASQLAEVFAAAGDSVMARLRKHVSSKNFHLDEQIDRNSGNQISAEDLTWSYAEMLSAMHARDKYMSKK